LKKLKFNEIIITCEHGGSEIPDKYADLFKDQKELLESYRGYDPGALEHAKKLAEIFSAPLHYTLISRTLVDFNRSPYNWDELFTEVTGDLDDKTKQSIMDDYYWPYRQPVEDKIRGWIDEGKKILHLSIHSFTHNFKGMTRDTDIGLLYDPERESEVEFCKAWRDALVHEDATPRIDMNEPYAGTDDGFTLYLRKLFREEQYVGLELEFNRDWIIGERKEAWNEIQETNINALKSIIDR